MLTSTAVHRWNTEIQEGINNMLQLLIDLVVARLQHLPVHQHLMDVLTMVCWKIFSLTEKKSLKCFHEVFQIFSVSGNILYTRRLLIDTKCCTVNMKSIYKLRN